MEQIIFNKGLGEMIRKADTKAKAEILAEKINEDCMQWQRISRDDGEKLRRENLRWELRNLLGIKSE